MGEIGPMNLVLVMAVFSEMEALIRAAMKKIRKRGAVTLTMAFFFFYQPCIRPKSKKGDPGERRMGAAAGGLGAAR